MKNSGIIRMVNEVVNFEESFTKILDAIENTNVKKECKAPFDTYMGTLKDLHGPVGEMWGIMKRAKYDLMASLNEVRVDRPSVINSIDAMINIVITQSPNDPSRSLKVFEIRVGGEKEWVCAYTNIGAIKVHSAITDMDLVEYEDTDEVIEIPENKWPEMRIMGDGDTLNTFEQYMKKAMKPDIIATSLT